MKPPKIAIFYDWINQWGGAEKVLCDLLEVYPDADLYTLVYKPDKTPWLPKNTRVFTSFINKLPFSYKNPVLYTPFYSLALEQFDFSSYDIVISTTSTVGHCLLTPTKTVFICYYHNINRHIYQNSSSLLKTLLSVYRKIDKTYSHRPDYCLCNSKTVQKRIQNTYKRNSKVIYPGIDTSLFQPGPKKTKPYFLMVSRLVPHKKIEIAIEACHRLNKNLLIVGNGRNYERIKSLIESLGASNIKLLGSVTTNKLVKLYQNCQALICPQEEDFGLTPLEAQSCGKPVIAFNKGGLTETVIDGKTGILFDCQTVESLIDAVNKFEKTKFSQNECLQNAAKFSKRLFMLNFKNEINRIWIKHLKPETSLF